MAERPAFFIHQGRVAGRTYSFEWFPGFSLSQKQKSIQSLHRAVREADSSAAPLEISTKSPSPLGQKLSAFRLRLEGRPLECAFRAPRSFQRGGPYLDLLEKSPKEAKRDPRLRDSGPLIGFRYRRQDFPLVPPTAFYDFLYLAAVKESLAADEIRELSSFSHFTDIEFNPAKSVNTQARSAALLRLLLEQHGHLPDFSKDNFIQYHQKRVVC